MSLFSIIAFSAMHVDITNILNWPSIIYYIPLANALCYISLKINEKWLTQLQMPLHFYLC